MNLTRQELDDLLVDYLYDELDDARRAEFEAGVQAYPDLAAEVEAHQQTRSMARALPQVALPAGFLEGLMAQVEAAPAPAAPAPTPTRAAAASAKPAGLFARFASFFLQPNFAMAVSALVVAGVAALVIAKGAHQGDDADDQIVHGGASLSAAESPAERPVVVPPAPPAVAPALEESPAAADGALARQELAPAEPAPAAEPEARSGDVAGAARAKGAVAHVETEKKAAETPAKAPTTAATANGVVRAPEAPVEETFRGVETDDARPDEDADGAGAGEGEATGGKTVYKSLPAALPEVPIAVPEDTGDLAKKATPAPAEEGVATKTAQGGAAAPGQGSAGDRSAVPAETSTGSSTAAPARDDAKADKDAKDAAVAALWQRYADLVKRDRLDDAEEVLRQLERAGEAGRVREARAALDKQRAEDAARAKRAAAEKQGSTEKAPTIDRYNDE